MQMTEYLNHIVVWSTPSDHETEKQVHPIHYTSSYNISECDCTNNKVYNCSRHTQLVYFLTLRLLWFHVSSEMLSHPTQLMLAGMLQFVMYCVLVRNTRI